MPVVFLCYPCFSWPCSLSPVDWSCSRFRSVGSACAVVNKLVQKISAGLLRTHILPHDMYKALHRFLAAAERRRQRLGFLASHIALGCNMKCAVESDTLLAIMPRWTLTAGRMC
ncbi:hypothetical protein GDO78_004002 [Eleutherodactylus coqui]|uniref:Uncharacterized protein n=1 Tax=Eleutherodactylus coqui TaxID=57060 RepID=A0A8J6EVV0_ELECQ|nr:hypothetical protein GDO78_004002 [Eleutherodactylus coqui]